MKAAVLGAAGQLGRALVAQLPDAAAFTRSDLDVADPLAVAAVDWSAFDVVFNATGYTAVDTAQTTGRVAAWRVNATAVAHLAGAADRAGAPFVHFSTEYVFDGSAAGPVGEDEPVAPLSVYGSSKAAGELAAGLVGRHLVLRTTWLTGDGANFVRTMAALAGRGVAPSVVADQVGRLSFADDVAAAAVHLVRTDAEPGVYHVTNAGAPASWADVARAVFAGLGQPEDRVRDTTTAAYFADRPDAAPRPLNSVLDLGKAAAAGVELPDWRGRLAEHLERTR